MENTIDSIYIGTNKINIHLKPCPNFVPGIQLYYDNNLYNVKPYNRPKGVDQHNCCIFKELLHSDGT